MWVVSRRIRWPHWRGGSRSALDWLEVPFVDVGDGILGGIVLGIALAILVAVVIVLVLPAILLVVEALIVAVGSLALRRAWSVEARTLGPPSEERIWRVRGPFASRAAVREVADELRRGVHAEPENAVRTGV